MGSKVNVYINKSAIVETATNIIKENAQEPIKKNAIDYFVFATKEKVKNNKALQDLKKQVNEMDQKLSAQAPIEFYFQAYELILDIRKFFLGTLGEIDYNILFSIKQRGGNASVNTINISHELFRNLLMDENGKIKGLVESNGNLRFNTSLIKSLKQILSILQSQGIDFSLLANTSSFRMKNEIVGKSADFSSSKLFKASIDSAKHRDGLRYLFTIDVKTSTRKDQTKVFSFFISNVSGSPQSSSIFSAIGKYSADQQLSKQQAAIEAYNQNISVSSTNVGNLSEIYQLAKRKLNNNENEFKNGGMPVPGQDLYEIYSQVLSNTDPFYMGGDILTSQVKSFLGACPSLTSFSTLRLSIKKFKQALEENDFEQFKKKITNLLIKKEDSLLKEEKELALRLVDAIQQVFNSIKE